MATFKVFGKEYEVLEDFDMGELAEIEKIVGQGYDMTRPGPVGMLALMYVSIRRVEPNINLDELRKIKPDKIDFITKDADVDPPALKPAEKPELQPNESSTSESNSSDSSDGNQEGRLRAIGAQL